MTKEETVKIMAMLGAFYSGGKNDPKIQALAWHKILEKYDYRIAEQAVLNFAENDTRDYATFPTVGVIVREIRSAVFRKDFQAERIVRAIAYGRDYDSLVKDDKELIPKEMYDEWLKVDAEEFSQNIGMYKALVQTRQVLLMGK